MKLNAVQISTVEEQLACEVIADDSSVVPRLQEAFGDHTFFLSQQGLSIVETDPAQATAAANVIYLASWDEDRKSLLVHEPKVRPEAVDLTQGKSDGS